MTMGTNFVDKMSKLATQFGTRPNPEKFDYKVLGNLLGFFIWLRLPASKAKREKEEKKAKQKEKKQKEREEKLAKMTPEEKKEFLEEETKEKRIKMATAAASASMKFLARSGENEEGEGEPDEEEEGEEKDNDSDVGIDDPLYCQADTRIGYKQYVGHGKPSDSSGVSVQLIGANICSG
jgi:flagellar biosynthesis GTPase FlhF